MAEAKRRGTARDLILSLAVFAVVLVGAVAFVNARNQPSQKVQPVAYDVTLRVFRQAAPFPVYAPSPVPAGWAANHAIAHHPDAADPAWSWDLGFYVQSSDEYVAVEQSSSPTAVAAQLGATGRQTGTTVVAGTTWQTWSDAKGHPALVRAVTGSTLVLDGVASERTLETLAAALTTT